MAIPTSAQDSGARLGIPATDLAMIAVVLIWGLNFSMAKIALGAIPPLPFAALRFGSAAVLLWLILRWREGAQLPAGPTFRRLIWIGFVGNTLYQACFVYGLALTSAANASLLIATTPAMVAFAGALLGIEPLRRNTVAGIALAFAGVALVLLAKGVTFSGESIVGDLLLIGCSAAWTVYTLGVRSLGAGLSPLAITTWTMITGAPGLIVVSLPQLLALDWAGVGGPAWASLAYSSLFALVVAYVLWNNSVRVAGSTRTAIYGCAIPLCAALFAWPILGEQPTWLQGAGAALIVAGVLLTRRP
jgi:drug/metabolite transporter (DMT)-like permease